MKRVKTLIVDDEIFAARDLQSHLERMGHTVTSIVSSGKQAILEIENEVPGLVLMDIVLQEEMDGIETAEIIRSRFNVPVIFFTAHEDKATFERAKMTEPFGYIVKPFQEQDLRRVIEIGLFRYKAEQKRDALARKHWKRLNEFLKKQIIKRRCTEDILQEQKNSLERKSIALSEVLGQFEIEKRQMEDNVMANAENLLMPTIRKLELTEESHIYAQLLQKNLEELTSSFGTKLSDKKVGLTSKEIEICNMIKNGLTSKEIAWLLNTSHLTIEKHRNNIRSKLGIANKKVSLSCTLKTL